VVSRREINACVAYIVIHAFNSPSSSAVAERPRDALCPSVVSLNKIITRAESLIIVT